MQSMVEEQKDKETEEIGAVVHEEHLQLQHTIRELQEEIRALRDTLRSTP
jgi:hypothetical protein